MEEVFKYLNHFLVLSDKAKELVMTTIDCVSVKKHTEIITIGRPGKYMYFIKKGVVRGFNFNESQEITKSLWMENEFFGDLTNYITTNLSAKSYQAIEETELYRINIAQFRSFFEINHEICNLARIIAEKHIIKSEYLNNCLRHLTAEEKYQFFLINKPGLIYRVKLKYIASYLDISPETLSRIRLHEICNQRTVLS